MFDNEDDMVYITPRKDRKTMDRELSIVPEMSDQPKKPIINEAVISIKNISPEHFGYILNEAIRLSERATCYTE